MYINVQGVHMKLFNRRKNVVDPSIPPEVQAYSQAEHRERMGVAWLVGVVSLVLTIFVLAGLFFGGRWLYRTIAGSSNNETQTQSTTDKDQSTNDKQQTKDENASTSKPESATSAPAGSTPQAIPASPTPTAPATTPTTGPSIPRTGPDSDE